MATCSSCGKVCIIQQERSFTTAADSCDVQLTLDDSQTPGVLSASLVVDDDPTNLLAPGTCGWSVPEAAIISVIDANICTILSDQSINCFGDVDTTTTPPTSGQFMAWNGTQWVPATLPAGTAVNIEDTNGNVTVLNGNGNIPLDSIGNVGYVTGGQLRVPGGAIQLKGTTYNLTPTQTVGATATTNTITFGIPTMPFASDLVITGRQIVATSYAAINSSHQIRMTTNIASTGPVLPIPVSTRDVILGFGTYNADSAEMYVQSSIISIPANTPAFNVTANCNIQILGLGGTTSASGTSGIFTVVIKPKTETIT